MKKPANSVPRDVSLMMGDSAGRRSIIMAMLDKPDGPSDDDGNIIMKAVALEFFEFLDDLRESIKRISLK